MTAIIVFFIKTVQHTVLYSQIDNNQNSVASRERYWFRF